MSWGVSSVNHKSEMYGGKLSWDKIGTLLGNKDQFYIARHSKNYWLREARKPHPATHEWATARCYRMYDTDILQYFEDGAICVITHPSAITYNEISQWGPVRCWQDNQHKYHEKRRFGTRDGSFPIPDGVLNIDRRGFLTDPVIDKQIILDPVKKAERTRIARDFRKQVLTRMMLGEFCSPDTWAMYGTFITGAWGHKKRTGWWARVPDRNEWGMAQSMLSDHFDERYLAGLYRGKAAKSQENAVRVACDQICYQGLLGGDEWHTTIVKDYGKVNIHDI